MAQLRQLLDTTCSTFSARQSLTKVDIVFVLDSSASMKPEDFERAKAYIINAIRYLDVDSGKVPVLFGSLIAVAFKKCVQLKQR